MDVGSSLGLGWTAAVHPDDRDGLAAAWRAALAAGTPVAHEARFRRRDGSYRWFDCRAVALRGSDGRVERWFGANTDVDDAHRVLEALAAEQALLARVAATAPGAIYSFHMDASGSARFPYVSPRMAELVGLPAEALAASAAGVEERISRQPTSHVGYVSGSERASYTCSIVRSAQRVTRVGCGAATE